MKKRVRQNQGVIYAPISGRVIPCSELGDEVFRQNVLGVGFAILPSDGRLVSPVDGVLSSIAEGLHAYGFTADGGKEILVHVGIDSVSLKGQGFRPLKAVGDRVRVGEPIAEIDLALLTKEGVSRLTPVIVCGAREDDGIEHVEGEVKSGEPLLYLHSEDEDKKEYNLIS